LELADPTLELVIGTVMESTQFVIRMPISRFSLFWAVPRPAAHETIFAGLEDCIVTAVRKPKTVEYCIDKAIWKAHVYTERAFIPPRSESNLVVSSEADIKYCVHAYKDYAVLT
jgi:hypothetical protein